MKVVLNIFFVFLLFAGCRAGAQQTDLDAKAFAEKMQQTPGAILIDVRTPGEYSRGFIGNAKNLDVRDDEFTIMLGKMDKSQPYFVYCLAGGRSNDAVNRMKQAGFTHVYNLSGGMIGWRKAGFEVNELESFEDKISLEEFEKMTKDEMVLVDFYAPWCGPCRKMEPYFEKISRDYAGKVKVIRINIDENKNLAAHLNVMEVPVIKRYQRGKETWESRGYTNQETLIKAIQP